MHWQTDGLEAFLHSLESAIVAVGNNNEIPEYFMFYLEIADVNSNTNSRMVAMFSCLLHLYNSKLCAVTIHLQLIALTYRIVWDAVQFVNTWMSSVWPRGKRIPRYLVCECNELEMNIILVSMQYNSGEYSTFQVLV